MKISTKKILSRHRNRSDVQKLLSLITLIDAIAKYYSFQITTSAGFSVFCPIIIFALAGTGIS
jgi:hypothetical protein